LIFGLVCLQERVYLGRFRGEKVGDISSTVHGERSSIVKSNVRDGGRSSRIGANFDPTSCGSMGTRFRRAPRRRRRGTTPASKRRVGRDDDASEERCAPARAFRAGISTFQHHTELGEAAGHCESNFHRPDASPAVIFASYSTRTTSKQ
jgi:hypothetical protein